MEHDKEYYTAIGLLSQGIDPNEVASKLQLSVSKVIRWNSDFKRHRDDGTLDKLLNMEELAIHTACQLNELPVTVEANAQAPADFQSVMKSLLKRPGRS